MLLVGCNTSPVRSLTSAADAKAQTDEEDRIWFASKKFDISLEQQGAMYDDVELTDYVQSVGNRLYPELKGVLRIQLVNSPDLNAFALGNGSIYLNTGLLARLDSEAQLATILSHEIAHFTEQHNIKQRRNVNAASTAAIGITLISGIPLSGHLIAAGAISGYSQSLEREADELGYKRYVAAQYDPRESVKVFEHLLAEVKALEIDQPFLFSSHPRLEERIASFRKLSETTGKSKKLDAEGAFLERTYIVRRDLLQRYLELHQYRTLILLLDGDEFKNKRYPEYWPFYLGEAFRQRDEEGDLELAESNYRRAIDRAPDFAPSYRQLGLLLMKADRNGEALENFDYYLTIASGAVDTAYVSGYVRTLKLRSNN